MVNKRTVLGLNNSSSYFLDFLFIVPDGTKVNVEIDVLLNYSQIFYMPY